MGEHDLRPDAGPPVLDPARLRDQTDGDAALERDVLTMFLARAEADTARLRAQSETAALRDTAHGIAGTARAIGAERVAAVAGDIAAGHRQGPGAAEELAQAIEEARQFVLAMLERRENLA